MTTNDLTVKNIYKRVSYCNDSYSNITHSYNDDSLLARQAIVGYLPKDSLAYKIFRDMKHTLSVKQTWVIAYELMKSEAYKQSIVDEIHETYGEGIDIDDVPDYEL